MEGLTDEMKSALKSAIDSKIGVSVEPKDVKISGTTDSAKEALDDAPKMDELTLGS